MYRANLTIILVVLLTMSTNPACLTDEPVSVGRPPVVKDFSPPNDGIIETFVEDTLTFLVVAIDPDESELDYEYCLNDSAVSSSKSWKYAILETGPANVSCTVTDGLYESRITWQVDRQARINYSPVITSFSPVEKFPKVITGNQIEFAIQAYDPDKDPISYYFTLDDSVVSNSTSYRYFAGLPGDKIVTAVVTDGEGFATHRWYLTVSKIPDTVPPGAVDIISVETGVEPGEIIVQWIAVGEDGDEGMASNYLLRTSPSPIIDELSWSRSSQRPGVPDPALPGEVMEMVVTGITPARYTYVAIRALDDFGNLSGLGNSLGGYARGMRISGKVVDAVTGNDAPNISVLLAQYLTTTDVYGDFDFIELPPLTTYLTVIDESQQGFVGSYFDFRMRYDVVHEDYREVTLIPNIPIETDKYTDFLNFYNSMVEKYNRPFPNNQRRWAPPIQLFVQTYSANGLDYKATVEETALALNTHLGFEAFTITSSLPDIGVRCIFRSDIAVDNYGVDTWTDDWYPIHGTCEFRTLYAPATVEAFKIVIRHELGHALGLNHSTEPLHLMVGGMAPLAYNFTPDEVALIRAYYTVPRGLDMLSYSRE